MIVMARDAQVASLFVSDANSQPVSRSKKPYGETVIAAKHGIGRKNVLGQHPPALRTADFLEVPASPLRLEQVRFAALALHAVQISLPPLVSVWIDRRSHFKKARRLAAAAQIFHH